MKKLSASLKVAWVLLYRPSEKRRSKNMKIKLSISVVIGCLLFGFVQEAAAFPGVRIRSVDFVQDMPAPYHHGVKISISQIDDPNLSAFKLYLRKDDADDWNLYDDAIKPYNSEVISLPYRGRYYAFGTDQDYSLRLCAVYGNRGEECSEGMLAIPRIAGSQADIDDDGISEADEYRYGTDPLNPDSDLDDMSDRFEIAHGLDSNLTEKPSLGLVRSIENIVEASPYGDLPEQHQAIILENTGDRFLRIFDILVEDDNSVFRVSNNYQHISEIAPGNAVGFNVDFIPETEAVESREIVILSDDRAHYPLRINLRGQGTRQPSLNVDYDQEEIDFGEVEVGATVKINISVENVGFGNELRVTAYVSNALNFQVFPRRFELGRESRDIVIRFTPDWAGTYEGVLKVQGENDKEFKIVKIPIRANIIGPAPRLRIEPNSIRFPRTEVGESTTRTIIIHNDGDGQLYIKHIDMGVDENRLNNGIVAVFSTSSNQLLIPPKSSRPLKVTFKPFKAIRYSSRLCIISNDPQFGDTQGCGVLRTIDPGMILPTEAKEMRIIGEGTR